MTKSFFDIKVIRYNSTIQPIQTIQYHKTGKRLYSSPVYITENGDVVVSDILNGVVVTDREGNYRFTYKGQSMGDFMPSGICVDALLNILMSSRFDETIHIINKDGVFLSVISTIENGMFHPQSLAYDEKNHLV
ncbi:uncharacterized protein LOC134251463 [Saccostrea cucullata]|uniref:uncharacterized protein LOC134251463 n=1 Tax=Saccostrea cuccullata TaxID=36930 RepID=UPI002ED3E193